MQRRKSIQKIALLAGGIIVLPSWAKAWSLESLPLSSAPLNIAAQNTLALIIETIIPESDTKGAKSLGIPAFVDLMLADCYEQKVVDNVAKGLVKVENLAIERYQLSFSILSTPQKEALLLSLEKDSDSTVKDFYSLIKNLSIQGYTNSEYVQTNFLKYKMAPGYFHGCVDVQS